MSDSVPARRLGWNEVRRTHDSRNLNGMIWTSQLTPTTPMPWEHHRC
jgi:hypothetical protein